MLAFNIIFMLTVESISSCVVKHLGAYLTKDIHTSPDFYLAESPGTHKKMSVLLYNTIQFHSSKSYIVYSSYTTA